MPIDPTPRENVANAIQMLAAHVRDGDGVQIDGLSRTLDSVMPRLRAALAQLDAQPSMRLGVVLPGHEQRGPFCPHNYLWAACDRGCGRYSYNAAVAEAYHVAAIERMARPESAAYGHELQGSNIAGVAGRCDRCGAYMPCEAVHCGRCNGGAF